MDDDHLTTVLPIRFLHHEVTWEWMVIYYTPQGHSICINYLEISIQEICLFSPNYLSVILFALVWSSRCSFYILAYYPLLLCLCSYFNYFSFGQWEHLRFKCTILWNICSRYLLHCLIYWLKKMLQAHLMYVLPFAPTQKQPRGSFPVSEVSLLQGSIRWPVSQPAHLNTSIHFYSYLSECIWTSHEFI